MKVETNAEVVEVAAELEFVFPAFEAVGIAEGEEFSLGNVVTAIGFEGLLDADPGFWKRGTDVGELADVMFDCGANFRETAISRKVGGKDFFEIWEAFA